MRLVADILICLRFLSRLPVPATRRERALGPAALSAAAAMAPLAGAVLGLAQGIALLAALACGLAPTVAAAVAVATAAALTGALHEDGLADCADGLGGRDRERRLAIMRDSRIGAYGATAVALAILLRSSALAAVTARSAGQGMLALLVAGAASRAACLVPIASLPPARPDGLGAGIGRPSPTVLAGMAATLLVVAAPAALGLGPRRVAAALAAAAAAAAAVSAFARRRLGGQTGDIAGAAQQLAEIAVLLALSAS